MTVWIYGGTRSGKTTALLNSLQTWLTERETATSPSSLIQPAVLVLVANDDNRRDLRDRLPASCFAPTPLTFKTPFGFIADEVLLFWPLLAQKLHIRAPFPIRLRPETEQVLATQLWQDQIAARNLAQAGVMEYRFIRDTLDVMQLAGAAGIALEKIAATLTMGFTEDQWEHQPEIHSWRQALLLQWRDWCLERGLLSYGLISWLYGQYLLGDRTYQQQLYRRYQAVFADDVQDYPALIATLLRDFLIVRPEGALTFNPQSCVRVGLNADPTALAGLQALCETHQTLSEQQGLAPELADTSVQLVLMPQSLERLPNLVCCIETITRAQLLRQTANHIVSAVRTGQVEPHEIAVIAPGLDAIARYSFMQILRDRQIAVTPLNEQNPLTTSPLVRALLTLLPFIYDNLGDLLNREQVAEMLVVLSQGLPQAKTGAIDLVRAGLLAEHCYHFHPQQPELRAIATYARWDRLSHRVVEQYQQIRDWLSQTRQQVQALGWTPPIVLDRAIKQFLWQGSQIPYAELSALRGIMETAQHFWAVQQRLRQHRSAELTTSPLRDFIELLRYGTITANAYPIQPNRDPSSQGVMLTTIYQYRALRHTHRWHYWLDAGSSFWENAGDKRLFGAPLFLEAWSGFPIDETERVEADQYRLEQVLRDLLARVDEQVFLCHSDLAVNGIEQTGPLINLVQSAQGIED
ncbi:MAG: recombinase family protein [Spirulina sp. SIO3F2]|nr:recombinase family protein [Spirulina sp. SIO3F2]